jgi:alkylation response protein AidB-like acyl-CoA dehydrogenase
LIQTAGTDDDKARLLPGLADGTSIATVAVTGARGTWSPDGVAVQASPHHSEYLLTGSAHYVLDGQIADIIMVVARTDQTNESIGVFEVAPDTPGFKRTAATVFDTTVRMSTVNFDRVPARRVGVAGWAAVAHALSLSVIALAGEQAGGTRRIFDDIVDYLKTRIQFGRPIGSFQALKHMAADLLLEVESSTSAAQHAAAQFDADPANADGAIALAGFACAEAYHTTAMEAIQMHGGIAFTWEHPAHLFLRRARSGRQLFGSSRDHRERYLASKGA